VDTSIQKVSSSFQKSQKNCPQRWWNSSLESMFNTSSKNSKNLTYFRYENSLEICKPYLKIVDDDTLANILKQLVGFDFKPGDSNSFKAFDNVYKESIDQRGTVELQSDYQELLQLQGEYYTKAQKGDKMKENFYSCLKYLFKKNSLKAFNDEVIKSLDFAFESGFHPNDLLDEEMKEYREWKEKSEPFNFLSTYCELLHGIKDGNNPVINMSIKKIFTEIQVPLQYKIRTIQTI
jgi:hypothetical protein